MKWPHINKGSADFIPGVLCGSQLVTHEFIRWLMDHPEVGDLDALCGALGIHKVDFIHQASTWFDQIKHKFEGTRKELRSTMLLTINGEDGAARRWFQITVDGYAITSLKFPAVANLYTAPTLPASSVR